MRTLIMLVLMLFARLHAASDVNEHVTLTLGDGRVLTGQYNEKHHRIHLDDPKGMIVPLANQVIVEKVALDAPPVVTEKPAPDLGGQKNGRTPDTTPGVVSRQAAQTPEQIERKRAEAIASSPNNARAPGASADPGAVSKEPTLTPEQLERKRAEAIASAPNNPRQNSGASTDPDRPDE